MTILNEIDSFDKLEASNERFCKECRSSERSYQAHGGAYYCDKENIAWDHIEYCQDCGCTDSLECDRCDEEIYDVAYIRQSDNCALCEVCHGLESEVA